MAVVVDQQAREERGEQLSPDGVVGAREERVGTSQEVQVRQHGARALVQVLVGRDELVAQACLLELHRAQPLAKLVGGDGSVRRQVHEPFLVRVELLQLLPEPGVLLLLGREGPLEGGADADLGALDVFVGEGERGELRAHRVSDGVGRQVRQVACSVLPAAAEVVLVDLLVVILGFRVDEPVLTAGGFASAAEHQAAQKVAVDDVTLASPHAQVDHLLDPLEHLRGDERVVAARVQASLEGDHSEVVRIAQDDPELAPRQRAFGPLGGLACGQPLFGERRLEPDHAVVAARVLLECPSDERGADRIHVDRVDEAAIEVLPDVEVAELRAPDRAPVLRLVQQLVLDVLARLADLHLVHDVGDGFHRVGHVAVAELFLGRDELHAHARQDALGDGGVGLVAEDARAHVDDDVADVGVLLDEGQQLAEDGPLGDRLGGVAGFDERLDDRRLESLAALDAQVPLSRDRVAVRVDVDGRVHLPLGGHPEVQDGLPADLVGGRRRHAVQAEELLPAGERRAPPRGGDVCVVCHDASFPARGPPWGGRGLLINAHRAA